MEKTTKIKTEVHTETQVIEIKKNTIIIVLIVALFIMTLVALGLAVSCGRHGSYGYMRNHHENGMSEKSMMPNDYRDTYSDGTELPMVPVSTIQVEPTLIQ